MRALPAAVRVMALAVLLVAALATSAVVGGQLLRSAPVLPTPNRQPVTEPSRSATAPVVSTVASARPVLGPPMSLIQRRPYGLTVVGLPDGRVAILGGGVAQVELWDPTSGHSVAAGSLSSPRAEVTAGLLADGRILVFGGFDARDQQQTRLTTAEIYDPMTGVSTRTGDPGVMRMTCHCGTPFRDVTTIEVIPMLDGRLLIVGGAAQAEVFDPTRNGFRTVAGGCDAARGAAARLRDGRVLVTCLEGFARTEQGVAGPGTNKAELFDPATDTFVPIASPTTTDSGAATLLDDGRVLLTGPGLAQDVSPAETLRSGDEHVCAGRAVQQQPVAHPPGRWTGALPWVRGDAERDPGRANPHVHAARSGSFGGTRDRHGACCPPRWERPAGRRRRHAPPGRQSNLTLTPARVRGWRQTMRGSSAITRLAPEGRFR